jgi:multidrug efflux pump subunit AcrB
MLIDNISSKTDAVGAGIAGWSIRHPVGVVMLTLAVVVLGMFSLSRLKIDLLPHIIYPDVVVRVVDPGVPAKIMEDEVTRQLEEQLSITEDAVHISSNTSEGRSQVNLSFAYGKDIDVALRDASTRLDRAKRFMPDSIDPPVIFKRDPSQLPAAEYAISSTLRSPVELRDWVDYTLGKWLINIPGVAAAEVGGGQQREIQIIIDQDKLAAQGLDILDVEKILQAENKDISAGRLQMQGSEISGRTSGRFNSILELAELPLKTGTGQNNHQTIHLGELAKVVDGQEEERIRIRLNQTPGIKLSIQKQPQANTVAVVDNVNARLQELQDQNLVPEDIQLLPVNDEARHIRRSLSNASMAALSGAILAMLTVYLFLGSLRRTLIIGSAIPIAILATIILMSVGGLTLNIMTLGGLALGIGMLVDSTIVMLENIYRHQLGGESPAQASLTAAAEVNGAIVASTSTNLAAVLPFLFIGGLIGLLFRELIFTISAAILTSMIVALTLIPALAGHIPAGREGWLRRLINRLLNKLQNTYAWVLKKTLKASWLIIGLFCLLLITTAGQLIRPLHDFLPKIDDGRVSIRLTADRGISVSEMDNLTRRVEEMIMQQPRVSTVLTTVGGFTFGRSVFESANRASIHIQLKAEPGQAVDSDGWIKQLKKQVSKAQLAGVKIRMRPRGIRGLRFSQGSDDVNFNVKGAELPVLENIADQMVEKLQQLPVLQNVQHSSEDINHELSIQVDRERARRYDLTVDDVGQAVRFALEGKTVTDFISNDRSIDVLLRLNPKDISTPADLNRIILFSKTTPRRPLRLSDIASVELTPSPASIKREQQQRIVEVSATLSGDASLSDTIQAAQDLLEELELPHGYTIYEAGNLEALKEGQNLSLILLGLALFLVLVVMSVQYESLRNPLIIMFSVAFASIGVALGLKWTQTPISMPVWLGLIMLAGIVVNNAIVLVEYIELKKRMGLSKRLAIIEAARLRLRPILMTTLTTVVGMLPLALALGEGSEMLQPLAITIVSGLLFSTLVSLLLVPAVYYYVGAESAKENP